MSDWQRLDLIVIEHKKKAGKGKHLRYHEYLVAADHPEHNQAPWIVVANDDDWERVGTTYVLTDWVERHDAKLVWRQESVTDEQLVENGFESGAMEKVAPWKDHEDEIDDLMAAGGTQPVVTVDAPETGTTVSPRAAVLREAEGLIDGDRNDAYGHPTQNFTNIATLWNVQFAHLLKAGAVIEPQHVAQAMAHVKLARMVASAKRDHYVDLAGYAGCGWEAQNTP